LCRIGDIGESQGGTQGSRERQAHGIDVTRLCGRQHQAVATRGFSNNSCGNTCVIRRVINRVTQFGQGQAASVNGEGTAVDCQCNLVTGATQRCGVRVGDRNRSHLVGQGQFVYLNGTGADRCIAVGGCCESSFIGGFRLVDLKGIQRFKIGERILEAA
jgi:hypothetical protein